LRNAAVSAAEVFPVHAFPAYVRTAHDSITSTCPAVEESTTQIASIRALEVGKTVLVNG
jgi:hypothetical protein